MYHGYYEQNQYLPIVFTCAENDAVVLVGLRHGTCHAALGVDDDLRYLVGRMRAVWPDVHITLRGDSGFATPLMYEVCDELKVTFTIGLGMNLRLKKASEELLNDAMKKFEDTQKPQRFFIPMEYQADTWPVARPVVIKVEVNAQGTNRRAVVTSRLGWMVEPQATYDDYAKRGESENRNKELKCELQSDRLSDHRFVANFFRLHLHASALNLMVRMRQTVALPDQTPAELGLPNPLPAEVLDEPDRKRYSNRRRERDPLGEGFACTWRSRFIKVAAEIIVSARRVLIRLSGTWPHLDQFKNAIAAILGARFQDKPSG
jgi:hypothetical protein